MEVKKSPNAAKTSVAEMRELFPDYPCGRANCQHRDNYDKCERCASLTCVWFDIWFSEHWHNIQENMKEYIKRKDK